MKSARLMCFTAVMFAVLASPVQFAAQDNQDHNHTKQVRYSVEILPTLGGTTSDVVGINNRGEAAGSSLCQGTRSDTQRFGGTAPLLISAHLAGPTALHQKRHHSPTIEERWRVPRIPPSRTRTQRSFVTSSCLLATRILVVRLFGGAGSWSNSLRLAAITP
jgi:hypothetical protein